MTDAAITSLVAGIVSVATMVVGVLTLWVKLKYAGDQATRAAQKAVILERKLDANTVTTNAVDGKTSTIVEQTDGVLAELRGMVVTLAGRVEKIEEYHRDSSHRVLDAVHAMHMTVASIAAVHPGLAVVSSPKPSANTEGRQAGSTEGDQEK